ncbi:hypothetical protein BDW02DRAFT_569977 [Decorospora gaudefroyi]|uniref:Mediator of RNA polymerase II transcription subunit 20 n=1 Tax=Decorospora gaudefroyi TaxID=184978 RepID=A0A6A5KGB5_9PLEO|nr:hypothetical protein BDW02DRAFT_569977 [Decorospora gaudefroyi]
MKYSGLYFISNPSTTLDASLSTVTSLIQGLESSFQNATRQPPWSLSYRLFRDTIPPAHHHTPPAAHTHSYQHLLHLSGLAPNRTYVCTQPANAPAAIASIPLRQQEAHSSILRHQASALWTPRHTLAVRDGTTYTGGLYTIQIGELRAAREGPQSGAVSSPGVVVCITTEVGACGVEDGVDSGYNSLDNSMAMDVDGQEVEEETDFEFAQTMIRECWGAIKQGRDLGRSEVKETMMASVATTKKEEEREIAVRMWCDTLRMRG